MNKQDALGHLKSLGIIFPENELVHFANICNTPSKSVWWLEIPRLKVKENIDKQLSLVLHNEKKNIIYHLIIPARFLDSNSDLFSVRLQKTGVEAFSFELSLDTFKDIRPSGSGLSFEHFVHGIFKSEK